MARYPFLAGPVVGSWSSTFKATDLSRVNALRDSEPQDWCRTFPFRNKGDDGHERPWFAYQAGDYDSYPENILHDALDVVAKRREAVEDDPADLAQIHIHHWQNHNPVTTEALVQLTLGGPQQRYNGGPFRTCFRYFDAQERRSGLPQDVSALVSKLSRNGAVLTLTNSHAEHSKELIVQGGFYGEHKIGRIRDLSCDDAVEVGAAHYVVTLPAQSTISMEVDLDRNANPPRFTVPALA